MVEVRAPKAVNPADRTVARQPTDNSKRTSASLPFRVLLKRSLGDPVSAKGPAHLTDSLGAPQTSPESPLPAAHGRARRDAEGLSVGERSEAQPAVEMTLDPLICQLAMNHGSSSFVQPDPTAVVTPPALPLREDLQNLLTGLARRTAWGGDRRKGSARIELSSGALAGATLVVHAEQRTVTVELELPRGMSAQGWQQRIAERLEGRGLAASVRVASEGGR
jgi:hypothetical protein